MDGGTANETPVSLSVPEAARVKERIDNIYNQVQHHLEKARERYKEAADQYRIKELQYSIGDEVLLSTKNIRTERPTKKLDYKWIGPYLVKKKINEVAYEIELPSNVRIHNVFHVSLLKKYIRPKDPARQLPKAPPLRITEEEGYVIKDIKDVRRRGKGWEYLVIWEGYSEADNTWEPRKSLNDEAMLRAWHERHPNKPSPYKSLALAGS
ncbi:hypothetical protein SeMB42_g04246 [Synchytrium endobioticum]|uniref:Chromo domain-containing protein n=1 Tax=Synchytrium endobioticum TaxID=286115 RepID=A0A507CZW0_9FUNG|nr:hypothetical protein SeMB42_g04246 [Synchytrium endobioticum]